ncbi:unnamed protein product [Microthlaspi erraticum]|uniref:Mob1/phocein family protein n=1 Tax=Microthlaspi erraticum TaxID=1685480 RepID=A0A6D2I9Z5_9BRAS|nr:unnamed protein product [Microthlaspi erraticum]
MSRMQISVCTTLSRDMSFFGLPSSPNQQTTGPANKRNVNPLSGSQGPELEKVTSLSDVVKLPLGEDVNEWLAINTVDFCSHITALYNTVGEFCTPITCPNMDAGSTDEDTLADAFTTFLPRTVSAPEYVEHLTDWIDTQMGDETIFPRKPEAPFPPDFKDFVKRILKRLYRVFAHIYRSHYQKIVCLEMEPHLNTCFEHFVLFVTEFQLVDKIELDALKELVEKILAP